MNQVLFAEIDRARQRMYRQISADSETPPREVLARLKQLSRRARRANDTSLTIWTYCLIGSGYKAYSGSVGLALRWYRKAQQLEPDCAIHHLSIASCLLKLGRRRECHQHLELARRLGAVVPPHR